MLVAETISCSNAAITAEIDSSPTVRVNPRNGQAFSVITPNIPLTEYIQYGKLSSISRSCFSATC